MYSRHTTMSTASFGPYYYYGFRARGLAGGAAV